MSGIVGIHYFDGRPIDPADVSRMLAPIKFRGPDTQQVWSDGSTGLGHCMLHTTPESLQEQLPLYVPSHELAITADARIDNRSELFQKLGIYGSDRQGMADSELILLAYRRWGERCVDHLLGDFAFAIWDRRRQQVFCARDHFGVRPFFYHYDAARQRFLFASDIKAILAQPSVSHEFDAARLAATLIPIWTTAKTVYKSIRRLPPASYLKASGHSIKEITYWRVERPQELILGSEDEYVEGFRSHFEEAVRCRLRTCFPVAAHVSGGLDSSSVAAIAQRILAAQGETLHTVSMRFEKIPSCDESPYFRQITEAPGFTPHYVYPEQDGPLSIYQAHIDLIDEPNLPFNHHFTWIINRHLHQAGCRIALTGFDGDTIVGHGDSYVLGLMWQDDWATFGAEIAGVAQTQSSSVDKLFDLYVPAYFMRLAKQGKWSQFIRSARAMKQVFRLEPKFYVKYGLKPLLPESFVALWQRYRATEQPILPLDLVNASLASQTGLAKQVQNISLPDTFSGSAENPQLYALQSGIITHALEVMALNANAYGIEPRHPFMDVRFVNYCLSLPYRLQLSQGWPRYILRRSMKDILPEAICWRATKTNMSPAVLHGFWEVDRPLLQRVMDQQLVASQPYIEPATAYRLYRQLAQGAGERNNEARLLWQILSFALWFDHRRHATPE